MNIFSERVYATLEKVPAQQRTSLIMHSETIRTNFNW